MKVGETAMYYHPLLDECFRVTCVRVLKRGVVVTLKLDGVDVERFFTHAQAAELT